MKQIANTFEECYVVRSRNLRAKHRKRVCLMIALSLIEGVTNSQLPISGFRRMRPFISRGDFLSDAVPFRKLRQSLYDRVSAVSGFGKDFDVFSNRGIEIALAS